MSKNAGGLSLVCRVDSRYCALPIESVIETTRPLPIEQVPGQPDFVAGLSVIRGSPVPIVDAGRVLGGSQSSPTRWIVLKVGQRRVGLAVEDVIGVRSFSAPDLDDLPPLIGAANAGAIGAIGALDRDLLLVVQSARIVSEGLLASLEAEAIAS
jgi:purine-binding chemotaxis protein CheW